MANATQTQPQTVQIVEKPSRSESTVINDQVAILRELRAPASLIAIAEKVAAESKSKT
jgi:hypothetical protein